MVRQCHRLDGHEFEQTLRDSEGQGSLVCCSLWGHKELDMTEQLNNNHKELEKGVEFLTSQEKTWAVDGPNLIMAAERREWIK